MSTQMVFQRYEIKYLLTRKQKNLILEAMEPYMALDGYGRSTIRMNRRLFMQEALR